MTVRAVTAPFCSTGGGLSTITGRHSRSCDRFISLRFSCGKNMRSVENSSIANAELDYDLEKAVRASYFASKHDNASRSEDGEVTRMSLSEFFLTENEGVTNRGAISREQLAHFIDLTYVATIYNLNHLINGCGDSSTDVILLSLAYFFILFTSRYHFDVYSIMFYSVDLVHRALFLAFNLGVFVMTYNIKATPMHETEGHRLLSDEHTDHHEDSTTSGGYDNGAFTAGECTIDITYIQGFASGYLASRLTLVIMYALLIYFARLNGETNSQGTYIVKMIPLLVGAIIMLPIYWETVNPVRILFAVALVEMLADIIPEVLNHYLHKYKLNLTSVMISMRPDVDHLQDRLQEFFLIVLGESMIGLLIIPYLTDDQDKTRSSYISTLFSFTLLFSLGSHFLVCVHRSADQVHAMKKKNALLRSLYIWLHPIICFVLLVATNALVQLTSTIAAGENSSVDSSKRLRHTLSVGLCLVVLLMVYMRLQHKGVVDHLRKFSRTLHILFKVCVAFTHLSLYYITDHNLYFILAHSLLATFTNIVEMSIPMFTESRAMDILRIPSTVDATRVSGAQKELNANRKSVLALKAKERESNTNGVNARASSARVSALGASAGHGAGNKPGVELKATVGGVSAAGGETHSVLHPHSDSHARSTGGGGSSTAAGAAAGAGAAEVAVVEV